VLLALAEAQARAGDMATAKATYLTAAGRARALGSPDRLARAALGYGGRFVWARAWGDTHLIPLLEEALAALPQTDGDLRARLLARLAGGPLRDTHPADARVAMARDAVAIARRFGDHATLAYALDGRHCANWGPDVVDSRREIAEELIRVAEAGHDPERVYAGHDYRFWALLERGDVAGADAELEIKAGWAQKLGQPAQLWDVTASRAMLDTLRGRFAAAEAGTHDALELGRTAQTANAKVAFALQLYGLRRAQGRVAEVVDLVERAVAQYPAYPVWRYVRADVLAQLGRTDDARAAFEELAATGFEVRIEMQWLVSLVLMPEVCRLLEERPRAAQLYAALRPYPRHNATTPPELSLGSVSRGLGILAATMGEWEAAAGHFADAREMNAAIGARPWLAYTGYDHALMVLSRDGEAGRDEAARLAARAAPLAEELGMRALCADLARLGGRASSV
jgi:tetratricopeptide (TPR) repeat protein